MENSLQFMPPLAIRFFAFGVFAVCVSLLSSGVASASPPIEATTEPSQPTTQNQLALVPEPRLLVIGSASYVMPETINVSCNGDETWSKHLQILDTVIQRLTSGRHRLEIATVAEQADLLVAQSPKLSAEEYQLNVDGFGVQIAASNLKGLAHATATLLQLIGSAAQDGEARRPTDDARQWSIPHLNVSDSPEVGYRNLMIDMGRNPHSLELLK
ncbi:MAG: glycoside hydrolase family 20 zincin-like fold domain-containing protein, partial [Planctomycetota bacterium]